MVEKRKASVMASTDIKAATSNSSSPYIPMFEHFRTELDEHHDRREKIIKASRDITASSKKIIFALQRVRTLNNALPANITKAIQPHLDTINERFTSVVADLQSINGWRYQRQITGGIQEWMEAQTFRHYLETQQLLSFEAARERLREVVGRIEGAGSRSGKREPKQSAGGEEEDAIMTGLQASQADVSNQMPELELTYEDYILGLFDTTGEMMRFAITTIATSGALPVSAGKEDSDEKQAQSRTVVQDLQAVRMLLSHLAYKSDFPYGMEKEMSGKLKVMLDSVEKVEKALYGLRVRGSERPKGWMPDLTDSTGDAELEA